VIYLNVFLSSRGLTAEPAQSYMGLEILSTRGRQIGKLYELQLFSIDITEILRLQHFFDSQLFSIDITEILRLQHFFR